MSHVPTIEEQLEDYKFKHKQLETGLSYAIIKRRNAEDQLRDSDNKLRGYSICFWLLLLGTIVLMCFNSDNSKWRDYYKKVSGAGVKNSKILKSRINDRDEVIKEKNLMIEDLRFWNRLKKDSERRDKALKDKKKRINVN